MKKEKLDKLVEIARKCKGENGIWNERLIEQFYESSHQEFDYVLINNENNNNVFRIKSCDVGIWLCTDSYVGTKIYFFDSEPLAYSYQCARKSTEQFYFFNDVVYHKTKSYLDSLLLEPTIKIRKIDELVDIVEHSLENNPVITFPFYTVSYNSQLLVNNGYLLVNNILHKVDIVEKNDNWDEHPKLKDYNIKTLKVKYENCNEEWIFVHELLIPFQPFN